MIGCSTTRGPAAWPRSLTIAALALLSGATCGESNGGPSEAGGAGRGNAGVSAQPPVPSGSNAPAPTAGRPGSTGGKDSAGAAGATPDALFTDPSVPDCLVPGAPWKLEGSIGGARIMLGSDVNSTVFTVGQLYAVGGVPESGDTRHPLILTWQGSLSKGASTPLTGKRFLVPGQDPAVLAGYCITAGDFGPTDHSPGVLLKFRVTAVRRYERGECTGPEQSAQLAGCMFRTADALP